MFGMSRSNKAVTGHRTPRSPEVQGVTQYYGFGNSWTNERTSIARFERHSRPSSRLIAGRSGFKALSLWRSASLS